VQWTADGKVIQTLDNVALGGDGIIMMNAWTGNPNWGGGPPAQDASVIYDWVKYWPGATAIPADAAEVRLSPRAARSASGAYLIFPFPLEGMTGVMAHRDGTGNYGLTGRRLGDGAPFAW
jgi:hypothetical protein